jgi:peptidoglycan/xylan/chitin deacetylase (PgdA/CDA1 family)
MMTPSYARDLIGYGPNPPDPQWPHGARLAVNFVLNYEEGSEPSFADGDGQSEAGLTESAGQSQGVRGRDLAAESMFEYGSRVGFWRIVRLFQERQLPLTVFGCALALERHPLAARTIAESGGPIDASGGFPDGTKFTGAAGLREALVARREQFATTLTEKLMTYALGRGVEYYDNPTVRAIARQAALDNYRMSSLIISIVKSTPFQMRRASES